MEGYELAELKQQIEELQQQLWILTQGDDWLKNIRTQSLGTAGGGPAPGGTAGGDLGGTYPNPTVDDGADSTAIHDNVANEITGITNKNPVAADEFVVEDSAASYVKKAVLLSALEAALTHDNLIAGTIADHDTGATGAELDTLTDGSTAGGLHVHVEAEITDLDHLTGAEAIAAVEGEATLDLTGTLTVNPDTDVVATIGRAKVGLVGAHGDAAGFCHYDCDAAGDYALEQDALGATYLNAKAGKSIYFLINHATCMTLNNAGNLIMADGALMEVDTINEATAAAGVTLDGVTCKDDAVEVDAIRGLKESGGQALDMGVVADGEYLKRSGTDIVGAAGGGGQDLATDTLWAAAGDIVKGTGDDAADILSAGASGTFLRIDGSIPYWDAPGIADTNPLVVDATDGAPNDDEYARWTATGLEGRSYAQVRADLDLRWGIGDDYTLQVDHADAADDDYAKFTANGIEGRSYSEVLGDLSGQASAAFDWGGQDLLNLGVIFLTEQAAAEADVAGKGQIWVKTATPNELWWTDDAGTDTQLGAAGGGGGQDLATDTLWAAAGDLVKGTGDDAADILSIGAAHSLLSSNGSVPSWTTTPRIVGLGIGIAADAAACGIKLAVSAADTYYGVNLQPQISGTSKQAYGVFGNALHVGDGLGSGVYGLVFDAKAYPSGAATYAAVVGVRTGVYYVSEQAVTITKMAFFEGALGSWLVYGEGSLTVTNAYGFLIAADFSKSHMTDCFGLKLPDLANATNNYILELGSTPYLRLCGSGSWTAAANETPLYLAYGGTPTLGQVQYKDFDDLGSGDKVMVLV